ncbi:MAG: SBBP repeat-containing protein [Bacteroidota bacterium]|nr:SBBP repeat-containing protein [Bacteroidota bacterium]
MKRLIFVISVILYWTIMNSIQAQSLSWAKRVGGNGDDIGRAIVSDTSGNSYVAISFEGNITDGITFTSRGGTDILVLKYNSKGEIIWSKQCGGDGTDMPKAIALDKEGNIYVTGYFSNNANFDNINLTKKAETDIFIAKFSNDGEIKWVKQAGDAGINKTTGICIDSEGNIIVSGTFTNKISFDKNLFKSLGEQDIFIVKYDNKGTLIWAKQAGGNGNDDIQGICLSRKDEIIATGFFTGKIKIGNKELNSVGKNDVFISKYDKTGDVVWLKQFGGTGDDNGKAVAVNDSGFIYVTGSFEKAMTIDKIKMESKGGSDVFYIKLNSDGKLNWAKSIGGNENDFGKDIKVNTNNDIILAITFSDEISPGKNNNESINVASKGKSDVLISEFSGDGDYLWNIHIGGLEEDNVLSVANDLKDNVYITGSFMQDAIFDTIYLQSAGRQDAFIAKYMPPVVTCMAEAGEDKMICPGEKVTLKASGGKTYLWSTGAKTQTIIESPTTSTQYTVTVKAGGCTSSASVEITVYPKINAYAGADDLICEGDTLSLNALGAKTFKWEPAKDMDNPNVQNPRAFPKVTTTYTMITTDKFGCTEKSQMVIKVNKLPDASAGKDTTICKGSSATLTAKGGKTYGWNTGDASQTIVVSPDVTTRYKVIVMDEIGCTVEKSVLVTVRDCPPK